MKISLIGASSFIGKNFIEFLDKKEIEINLVGTQRKKDNTLEHIIKNLSNIRYKQKVLDLPKGKLKAVSSAVIFTVVVYVAVELGYSVPSADLWSPTIDEPGALSETLTTTLSKYPS